MSDFPLPGSGSAAVAVPAPGPGHGFWAGSPGAALDGEGGFVLAYRVRTGIDADGGAQTVVARSDDGETFTTVATLDKARYGAMSMERPAIVRTAERRWRL